MAAFTWEKLIQIGLEWLTIEGDSPVGDRFEGVGKS
jgi:hypothetical protein